ncbi:MAG: hypothetical protein OER88_04945 [Planctomycetota bacterium]|nr:hypothetical protein [Planctomycetota bacterium]
MRSVAVILIAAALFGAWLWSHHARGGEMVARENAALSRLERGEAGTRDGYRVERRDGRGLPAVDVARPVDAEQGHRWFVRDERGAVYQYDTVRNRAPDAGPDVDELRRYLARPAAKRAAPPTGWEARAADTMGPS